MNIDILLEVLKDSFLSNFIFTFQSEVAFDAYAYFSQYSSGYPLIPAIILSCFGSACAIFVNFLLFYLLATKFSNFLNSNYSYSPFSKMTNKFKWLFGLLVCFPNASVISSFFCGITRVKPVAFLLIIMFYRSVYYAYAGYFG